MPPHAVQPYLGGSSEQRFSIDTVLLLAAVAVVAVVKVMLVVLICIFDWAKRKRSKREDNNKQP